MAHRGRGEGTLTHRKDGRWEAKMSLPNGTRRSFYGRTRSEAERKLREAQKARDEYLPIPKGRLTLEKFLRSWLRHIKNRGLAPTTLGFYQRTVDLHLVPALGKTPLVKLSTDMLDEFYSAKTECGLSSTTVRHIHAVLKNALKHAVKKNQVTRNVADLADPPRIERGGFRTLSWQEVDCLLRAAVGDRLEALYIIAVTTGAREGEILGLRWQHVNVEAGTIQIAGNLQQVPKGATPPRYATRISERMMILQPKTEQSKRQISLIPRAIEALRDHKLRQQAERKCAGAVWQEFDLVFTNEIGGPIEATNFLKRSFRPLLKMAGLPPIKFHELRHTCATLLLEEGTHPAIVAALLGHSRASTTLDIYSHAKPSLAKEIPSIINARLEQFSSELSSELSSIPQNSGPTTGVSNSKSNVN